VVYGSLDLDPRDCTDAEWDWLCDYWLARADHVGIWANFRNHEFPALEEHALRHPEGVENQVDGYLSIHSAVTDALRPTLRALLERWIDPATGRTGFWIEDLRLFSGGLKFLSIHDGESFYLHAVVGEMRTYAAFGYEESDLVNPYGVKGHDTWDYRLRHGADQDSPEARTASKRSLDPADVAALVADIDRRHGPGVLPPFSLPPNRGLPFRAFTRRQAEAVRDLEAKLERLGGSTGPASAGLQRAREVWAARPHVPFDTANMAAWTDWMNEIQDRYRDVYGKGREDPNLARALTGDLRSAMDDKVIDPLWDAASAVVTQGLLLRLRQVGFGIALSRRGALAGVEHPLLTAQAALPGSERPASLPRSEYPSRLATVAELSGALEIAPDLRLRVLDAYGLPESGVGEPERLTCAYRLEDTDGTLRWQVDSCPAHPGPHRHLPDGSVEPLDRLPSPVEVAREALDAGTGS
jgi:hypothetical protein